MSIVILSDNAPDYIKDWITSVGYPVYALRGRSVSAPVSCHPDMFISQLGHGQLICASSLELKEGFPEETAFNVLTMGNHLFCRTRSVSRRLLSSAEEVGLDIINVNQGYTACNVCKVNEHAAITSDPGLAKAMSKVGIEVLLIQSGSIVLPGYREGFIGGASGLLEDTLLFFGDVSRHPDWDSIRLFLDLQRRTYKYFPGTPLLDLGGLICLKSMPEFDANAAFTLTRYL